MNERDQVLVVGFGVAIGTVDLHVNFRGRVRPYPLQVATHLCEPLLQIEGIMVGRIEERPSRGVDEIGGGGVEWLGGAGAFKVRAVLEGLGGFHSGQHCLR